MNQKIQIRKEETFGWSEVIELTENTLKNVSGMVILPPEFA